MWLCMHEFLCTLMHMHFRACARILVRARLSKRAQESFITGPVTTRSSPEGNEVEMRDRNSRRRAQARARCLMPVPSGGCTDHYDVLQMDTCVCFLGSKSAKSRAGVVHTSSEEMLFVCICHRHLPGCHDVWH